MLRLKQKKIFDKVVESEHSMTKFFSPEKLCIFSCFNAKEHTNFYMFSVRNIKKFTSKPYGGHIKEFVLATFISVFQYANTLDRGQSANIYYMEISFQRAQRQIP